MCPDTVPPSVNADIVPEVLRRFIFQIEHLIDEGVKDRSLTHPPKIRNRANNTVVMWNIFPDKSDELNTLFRIINQTTDSFFTDIKGEVIKLKVLSGTIHDTGVQEFQIIRGKTWDVYLYDPEGFLYIRLLHERHLLNQEQWLSVDIDIITDSAWFVD